MALPGLSLKGRALRYLAAREHSRFELQRKLEPFEETPGELTHVLDLLEAKGFIDAQRVVDSVVHRRAGRLGAARIRHELLSKGLEGETVQLAVARLQSTELDRAREVWRKKFREPASDIASRAKQMRFLASRGFGAEAIRRVVAGADEDEG